MAKNGKITKVRRNYKSAQKNYKNAQKLQKCAKITKLHTTIVKSDKPDEFTYLLEEKNSLAPSDSKVGDTDVNLAFLWVVLLNIGDVYPI